MSGNNCWLNHDWGKWIDTKVTLKTQIPGVVVDAQERTCQRCGKKERSLI